MILLCCFAFTVSELSTDYTEIISSSKIKLYSVISYTVSSFNSKCLTVIETLLFIYFTWHNMYQNTNYINTLLQQNTKYIYIK